MPFIQEQPQEQSYDLLAYSALNSMNYLFLRHTFRTEQPQVIQDELQNFITSFDTVLVKETRHPVLLQSLKQCLYTELVEGSYVEDITKEQARQKFVDAIDSIGCESSTAVVNFYLSLLEDDDYADASTTAGGRL